MSLREPIQIVALGGPGGAALPPGIEHAAEPLHPPTNFGWTQVGLPRAAAGAGVDLIHAPAYTAPLWSRHPVVLTIHDVSYERRPEWYPYRRDRLRRAFYRRSARAASLIVTDSTFSQSEIQAAYGVPSGRVAVVPLGVSGDFRPLASGDACELPPRVRPPYLLHVGDLHERRNLPTIVDALMEARRRFGAAGSLSLVLAGVDRGVGDAVCAMAAGGGIGEAVVLLGPVEEGALRTLYQCATALVYPSMYEGFGFPVLEAMACGTPVIASRAASIPEVAGDAGVLLDPLDVQAWTDAILRIVNSAEERTRLRDAGLARASTFTWERTARLTLEAYRRVA